MGLRDLFELEGNEEKDEKALEEFNEEYLKMRENEEKRLKEKYDFNTIEGIERIPLLGNEVNPGSITGSVEYYLRSKCFSEHWNAGETELAMACLKKAQDLMYVSNVLWNRNDFMKLVNYLHKIGRHDEARKEEERIDAFIEEREKKWNPLDSAIRKANEWETDLLEVSDSNGCCEKCAMYRKRIYSISGKDKRFPKFPEDFHTECGLYPHPFIDGCSRPDFPCNDYIEYSNRPFVDDRTEEELESRKNILLRRAEEERTEKGRHEFFWLQENLPEMCPKSLSGYMRMKNKNSKTYQNLVAHAKQLGKILEECR